MIQNKAMIVDSKGTITWIKRDFEAGTGHSIKKILGKTCMTLSCNAVELYSPKLF